MSLSPSLYSPAYPAAWLLFGMLFALAVAHFMEVRWLQFATVAFYGVTMSWVFLLAWKTFRHALPFTMLDGLFIGFVVLAFASLIFHGDGGGVKQFAPYLTFLVLSPYLCGRLMCWADVALFMRVCQIAGLAILPLVLLDRFASPIPEVGRWPFFGLDHGALLVGALLAITLSALCVRALARRSLDERRARINSIAKYGSVALITAFLVWVTARGWLLVGLLGVVVVCLAARHRTYLVRAGLLALVLGVLVLSLKVLLYIDPMFSRIYSMPQELPAFMPSRDGEELKPILGKESCQSIEEGVNSVAIRWVLYQEAIAMFLEKPVFGVGAARFGEQSCTGTMGFPHSTILQGIAELGLFGGGLLITLLVTVAATMARPFLSATQRSSWPTDAFLLALFVIFVVGDQIYGNYFMSVGTWLLIGIAASMRASDKRRQVGRD